MGTRKNPKFKVGEIVVIIMYGTVGEVKNIKKLDGAYVYEISNAEGLFHEASLAYLEDYKGDIVEKEEIDIEYQYFFGDIVQVKGYGAELFKIVGFRTEIWRYKEDAWEDVIYELTRIHDGEWLEAAEEELILVADADSADTFIQKLGFLYLVNKEQKLLELKSPIQSFRKKEKEILDQKKEKKELINGLLDIYNDYQLLFQLFQDPEYEQVMKMVVNKLKQIQGNSMSRKDKGTI